METFEVDLPDTTRSNHNSEIDVGDYMQVRGKVPLCEVVGSYPLSSRSNYLLKIFNIPNLGIGGGVISTVLGVVSAKLFVDPFQKELRK